MQESQYSKYDMSRVKSKWATDVELAIESINVDTGNMKDTRNGVLDFKVGIFVNNEDPASKVYVKKKVEAINELNEKLNDMNVSVELISYDDVPISKDVRGKVTKIPASQALQDCEDRDVRYVVRQMTEGFDAVLLQSPIHKDIDKEREQLILRGVCYEKDIDALHPDYMADVLDKTKELDRYSLPCTAGAVLDIIETDVIKRGITKEGTTVMIIGRSDLVGRPLVSTLERLNYTVIWAHSRTSDEDKTMLMSMADYIVVATGSTNHTLPFFTYGKSKGRLIIDVGIHRKKDGKLRGDVYDKETVFGEKPNVALVGDDGTFQDTGYRKLFYCTPVPGGVGVGTVVRFRLRILSLIRKRVKQHMNKRFNW